MNPMNPSRPKVKYDVVIVGARCAGAATAMLLARQGKRVLVLERGQLGHDTLSTHGLMTAAVVALHRWGILPTVRASGAPLIDTTTFHYGQERVELNLSTKLGIDGLCAPRRTVLDRALVDAAVDAGAHFLFGARVDGLLRRNGRVCGVRLRGPSGSDHEVSCDLVVGADGRRSTLAALTGSQVYRLSQRYTACVYTYVEGLPVQGYQWFYGPTAHAGLIPTNDGAHCAFVLVAPEFLPSLTRGDGDQRFADLATLADRSLRERLEAGRRVEPFRTFTGQRGFVRTPVGPGWALVGDAGYFKDPCTAHGITDALRDAELLARAAVEGTQQAMRSYHQTRDELSMKLFELTDEIASFPANPVRLQQLHRALSHEMKREAAFVAGLDAHRAAA